MEQRGGTVAGAARVTNIETVQKIEKETARGDAASPSEGERWLKTLVLMAPDIFHVTVACRTSAVAGMAMAIRKIAEKAEEEV